MSSSGDNSQTEQKWPVAALVTLSALLITVVVFVWVTHQQQQMLRDMQTSAKKSEQHQAQMQQQFMDLAERLHQDRNQAMGFMAKQQHYGQLMALLSEVYILTDRQDGTALEEAQHRLMQAYFGVEPFLSDSLRTWMTQQLKAIKGLSNKLADPAEEYEENLLATKTSLRQMIDETHLKLYPALFGEEEVNDAAN